MSDLLPGFVEWLGRKDPNERYYWPSYEICACGQFASSIGIDDCWVGREEFKQLNRLAKGNQSQVDKPELDKPWSDFDTAEWTFGKLHKRAKAELETA